VEVVADVLNLLLAAHQLRGLSAQLVAHVLTDFIVFVHHLHGLPQSLTDISAAVEAFDDL
jgi:hypothetical protein